MNRQEKIQIAIDKGITCDVNTGKVYGMMGNELICKSSHGYLTINMQNNKKIYILYQHHFIYFVATGKIVNEIDHINGIRDDNRIDNLREVTRQQNHFNRTKAKGYTWHKKANKWSSQIFLNGENINLGLFDTEVEAHQAYLDAKKIYHQI